MYCTPDWRIDATKILTKREISAVLADLHRKAPRSLNTRMNLAIFRLASCCGLRVTEISGLQLGDVRIHIDRPHLVIRPAIAKCGHRRKIPLWWDQGTLVDIIAWVDVRRTQGATNSDPVVCSLQPRRFGTRLGRHVLRKRFRTSCRCLGQDRLAALTIHHGRHTFVSHALAGGRTLAEVRDAAGHCNVSTTSCYLHFLLDEPADGGRIFAYDGSAAAP
jgi:site-specific recombinase XerC